MHILKKRNLHVTLPQLAVFIIVIIAAVAIIVLYSMQMMQVEDNILKNGNLLLDSYITDTRDSIEKGQRKTFQEAMNKIVKLKDVQSVSLYAKNRLMVYKSGEVTIGKPFIKKNNKFFNPNIQLYEQSKGMYLRDDWSIRAHSMLNHPGKYDISNKKCNDCHYMLDNNIVFDDERRAYEIKGDSSYFYHDMAVEQECISCHTYWKAGESAGYLSLKMDNSYIINQLKGNITNFVVVMSLIILLFLIIGYYIQLLNKQIKAKSIEVEHTNRKINNLLNNAGQGFLSFDVDFIINKEYSRECIELLGSDLEGKDIAKILFSNDAKKYLLFKNSFTSMIQEQDIVIRKLIASLLPKTITLNNKVISIEYKALDNDEIMLILTNITLQIKLENKIKNEQDDLKMIISVITDTDTFFELKNDYEIFSKDKLDMINHQQTFLHHVRKFYRIIHTFKGSCSQFYMHNCVKELHHIENRLSEFMDEDGKSGEDMIRLLSEYDFLNFLEKDLNILRNTLGSEFLKSGDMIKVKKKYLIDLEKRVYEMMKQDNKTNFDYQMIYLSIKNLISKKMIDALKIYPKLCMDIASRLNKEIYEFKIVGDENIIMEDKHYPFIKSLIHIFRNAIDHGIEMPEIRCEFDKDEIGTIECRFEVLDDELQIIISDDGAGIDLELIKESALKRGLKTEDELNRLSKDDLYKIVFIDQLSTKKQVSNLSGRGVGMGAVKSELDKIGGTVQIESNNNKGTKFIFKIPLEKRSDHE